MLAKVLDWFGFSAHGHAHDGHGHDHGSAAHGHSHGVLDPSIATTERGIWAVKWSFVILAVTTALQLIVVAVSGSVALLADTIHNFGDAGTAIPLWIAFVLARRKPTPTFTYGYGRAEDLAGIIIVLIILCSAIVAGYQAIGRLINPQPIGQLGWVMLAGIVGFIGNEAVAVFRIRVGREIGSAALIADGYHARTDGLTSLAVVLGAAGVWLGFPLADPLVGLLITLAIFGIVWQSARAVLTRMLDGVEPGITEQIRHSAEHVPAIERVIDVKTRWLGHRLHADVAIAVADGLALAAAEEIASMLRRGLLAHLPALRTANITFGMPDVLAGGLAAPAHARGLPGHGSHHAPEPFRFSCPMAEGLLEIVDTPEGERMRLTVSRHANGLQPTVSIDRPGGTREILTLIPVPGDHHACQSTVAPAEPHEFEAELWLVAEGRREVLPFRMTEPAGHAHHH